MLSRAKQARDRIERLRLALLSPEPEEICAALPGLEEAAACLQEVEQELRGGADASAAVHRELKMLKSDLRISVRLVEQGMAFCQAWAKMLGSGPAYTQTGRPTALTESGGTLVFRG